MRLGRKDPASIVLRLEADKSQRMINLSRSRTRVCCAVLTHLRYFVSLTYKLGRTYKKLYKATRTSRAESQSRDRHKSLRALNAEQEQHNLARPHKSLAASPPSELQQCSVLISHHRLAVLERETCSSYIDVSLQGRNHQMVEVLVVYAAG